MRITRGLQEKIGTKPESRDEKNKMMTLEHYYMKKKKAEK